MSHSRTCSFLGSEAPEGHPLGTFSPHLVKSGHKPLAGCFPLLTTWLLCQAGIWDLGPQTPSPAPDTELLPLAPSPAPWHSTPPPGTKLPSALSCELSTVPAPWADARPGSGRGRVGAGSLLTPVRWWQPFRVPSASARSPAPDPSQHSLLPAPPTVGDAGAQLPLSPPQGGVRSSCR